MFCASADTLPRCLYLAGFSCGIGGMMIISQLRTIFALPAPTIGWRESVFGQLLQVMANLGKQHVVPALVAMIVVVVATGMVYRLPRSPAPLVGVIAALVIGRIIGWHEKEFSPACPGSWGSTGSRGMFGEYSRMPSGWLSCLP